jgi:hypothetical protein
MSLGLIEYSFALNKNEVNTMSALQTCDDNFLVRIIGMKRLHCFKIRRALEELRLTKNASASDISNVDIAFPPWALAGSLQGLIEPNK